MEGTNIIIINMGIAKNVATVAAIPLSSKRLYKRKIYFDRSYSLHKQFKPRQSLEVIYAPRNYLCLAHHNPPQLEPRY